MYGEYVIGPLGDYSVPTGWPMKPYKRPYGGTPGPPVMYEKPSDPETKVLAMATPMACNSRNETCSIIIQTILAVPRISQIEIAMPRIHLQMMVR